MLLTYLVTDTWMCDCRPSEGIQEIINAPAPLATVMNDKAKMDTEVTTSFVSTNLITYGFLLSFRIFVHSTQQPVTSSPSLTVCGSRLNDDFIQLADKVKLCYSSVNAMTAVL